MRLWLAPQVRAARVESDVVFLDISSDAYFCLVGAGAHLRLSAGGGVEADPPEAARDLVEAGLLSRQASPIIASGPPRVRRGLDKAGRWPRLVETATAVHANLRAAEAVAHLPFAAVLALAGPLSPSAFEAPSPALLDRAASFERLSPWLPRAGLCLMRSLQQRLFLARHGCDAAWVFGVRTWPFEAHCWVQAGDVVLGDAPDYVAGFTPIMAV